MSRGITRFAKLLGFYLRMRITVDILPYGDVCITPAQEREYRLRKLRIPVIENIGIIGDAFECLNLSDNSIVSLGGFPRLEMLTSLVLTNNQIKRIQRGLLNFLPNLQNLVLTNNQISTLLTLEALKEIPNLTRLTLIGNSVTKEAGYRLFVISMCPKLRVLDFQKVKQKEREEARKIHGEAEVTKAAAVTENLADFVPLDEVQKEQIKDLIKSAQSMDEVNRLEEYLRSGRIPRGVDIFGGDVQMEAQS